ncbi:MAG: type I 3-dehydroquinate dehydratase [Candidatus Hydrothermarchaeaceae archaeon]
MRVCASIMEPTIEGFVEKASMARGADMIEVRADGLTGQSAPQVEELLRSIKGLRDVPVILTNRSKSEGGAFEGSEKRRIAILLRCMSLADLVDVEYTAEKGLRDGVIEEAKEGGTEVIVSQHDFKATPDENEMLSMLRKGLEAGADIAKLAVTANSVGDVLSLLNVTSEARKEGRVITIAMGEIGRLSRIAAPLFGSEITYASVGEAVAPGQLELNELKTILEALA